MLRDPALPGEDHDSETPVLEWRRNGDVIEGLVESEVDGEVVVEWLTALDLGPET